MWFWICIICGWVILSFPLGILIGKVINSNSACNGNCRQGRDCDCTGKKDD